MTPTPITVPLQSPATPVTFRLQGTGELDIRSIVATWDGTSAGSAFYPVISVYTSDDRLLSRTRVQDAVAAGSSVVATFAPFLRKQAQAAATSSNFPWVQLSEGTTTIPDNTWLPVPFELLTFDPALVDSSGAGDIFRWTITDSGDAGTDRYQLQLCAPGIYQVGVAISMDQVTTDGTVDHAGAALDVWGRANNGSPISGGILMGETVLTPWVASADWPKQTVESGAGFIIGGGWLETHRTIIGGRSGPGSFNPNFQLNLSPRAIQTTGVSRGLTGQFLTAVYLGEVSNSTGWTYDSV